MHIMRWNDGNYWALKASTEKSHRTLVRFMKKWKVICDSAFLMWCKAYYCWLQAVLKQPVYPLLTASAFQQADRDKKNSEQETYLGKIYRNVYPCPVITSIEYTVKYLNGTHSVYEIIY